MCVGGHRVSQADFGATLERGRSDSPRRLPPTRSATEGTEIRGHNGHKDYKGGGTESCMDDIEVNRGSVLPPQTDALIREIIGCAIRVHSELGPGFLETIYASALAIEFESARIAFEREKPIVVFYRGQPIAGQRLDFVVADKVILEIKAAPRVDPIFQAKLISYLRATKLKAGLLINFNVPLLREGIKRIVV